MKVSKGNFHSLINFFEEWPQKVIRATKIVDANQKNYPKCDNYTVQIADSCRSRVRHRLRPHRLVKFLLRQIAELQRRFTQAQVARDALCARSARTCHIRSSDSARSPASENSSHSDRCAPGRSPCPPRSAPKRTARVGQQPHRVQKVVDHHGLENIQLKISLGTGKADRRVVAEDLHRDHGHRLGLRRIHFARHDRGPGSFSGSINSPKPPRGPEASQRTSFAIFISEAPSVFSAPLANTISSCAESAANLLGCD